MEPYDLFFEKIKDEIKKQLLTIGYDEFKKNSSINKKEEVILRNYFNDVVELKQKLINIQGKNEGSLLALKAKTTIIREYEFTRNEFITNPIDGFIKEEYPFLKTKLLKEFDNKEALTEEQRLDKVFLETTGDEEVVKFMAEYYAYVEAIDEMIEKINVLKNDYEIQDQSIKRAESKKNESARDYTTNRQVKALYFLFQGIGADWGAINKKEVEKLIFLLSADVPKVGDNSIYKSITNIYKPNISEKRLKQDNNFILNRFEAVFKDSAPEFLQKLREIIKNDNNALK